MTYLERVELLAKMENVLDVPSGERLTQWYGDYSMYEPKSNVTQADIDKRIEELDKQIQHSKPIQVEVKETLSRIVTVDNAISIREAIETVMEQYNNEEFVLDGDDYKGVEFDLAEVDFDMEL